MTIIRWFPGLIRTASVSICKSQSFCACLVQARSMIKDKRLRIRMRIVAQMKTKTKTKTPTAVISEKISSILFAAHEIIHD